MQGRMLFLHVFWRDVINAHLFRERRGVVLRARKQWIALSSCLATEKATPYLYALPICRDGIYTSTLRSPGLEVNSTLHVKPTSQQHGEDLRIISRSWRRLDNKLVLKLWKLATVWDQVSTWSITFVVLECRRADLNSTNNLERL